MGSYRNRPQRDYTIVRNRALRDKTLSLKAKGLLSLMLSFPDDWEYHLKHLEGMSTDGRDSLRAGVRELERAGYIKREQTRGESNKFSKSAYVVSDLPDAIDEDPGEQAVDGKPVNGADDAFSVDGKPDDGKPAPIKTDVKKTESTKTETPPTPQGRPVAQARREKIEILFKAYNDNCGKLPKAKRLNRKRQTALQALLREVGDEALPLLVDATQEVAADEYWQKNAYGFDNLLRSGRVVEKAEKFRQRNQAAPSGGKRKDDGMLDYYREMGL